MNKYSKEAFRSAIHRCECVMIHNKWQKELANNEFKKRLDCILKRNQQGAFPYAYDEAEKIVIINYALTNNLDKARNIFE